MSDPNLSQQFLGCRGGYAVGVIRAAEIDVKLSAVTFNSEVSVHPVDVRR